MEVLPAISLLATVSILAMKLLGISMQLRQRAAREEFIRNSHSLVYSCEDPGFDSIIMCRVNPDGGWELLSFPGESWLPRQSGGSDWIVWRRRVVEEMPHRIVATEFLDTHTENWNWWNSTIDFTDHGAE